MNVENNSDQQEGSMSIVSHSYYTAHGGLGTRVTGGGGGGDQALVGVEEGIRYWWGWRRWDMGQESECCYASGPLSCSPVPCRWVITGISIITACLQYHQPIVYIIIGSLKCPVIIFSTLHTWEHCNCY